LFDPLLKPKVQDFIRTYDDEVYRLIIAGSPFKEVSIQHLASQIESRRKIQKKLPTWFSTENIIYPPKLNLEQTSSEVTAKYKASLVSGEKLADITGGFGVDSYYFSEGFDIIHHFEINQELSEIAKHNFKVLGKNSIESFAKDGLKEVLDAGYDVIYADPSRRHDRKGKVFYLRDCIPNIPDNLSEILNSSKKLLLKTSPMLDISQGLEELDSVAEIHIVAVDNEVKELIWLIQGEHTGDPIVKAVNLKGKKGEEFNFHWRTKGIPKYGHPQKYLYEPNAAILKSGAFDLISERFKVNKLNRNTHLYTSDTLMDFPGRRFVIEKVIPYSRSEIRKALTFKKANISIRNFPESVERLRKKWKIQDGGDIYLFFVTDLEDKKVMIVCSKGEL